MTPVLRNAGPEGAPGMPEAGYLPIPKKLAQAGVKDMVRISDARMSGTAFGTIVLHITPESAGRPLGLVRDGDLIRLDVPARQIELLVDEAELERRTGSGRRRPISREPRGYRGLYLGAFCRPTKAATSTSADGRQDPGEPGTNLKPRKPMLAERFSAAPRPCRTGYRRAGAFAQALPDPPDTLVVPYAPGGATDIIGRVIAEEVSKTLGQRVVVENRAGAAGSVGAAAVAAPSLTAISC